MLRAVAPLALALALAATLACQRTPSPQAGGPVQAPALGLAFARLPPGFGVAANRSDVLELVGHTEKGPGTLVIEVGAAETNINLVDTVREQRARFESRPGGQYFGQRELVTPWGAAFTARGRFDAADGGQEEEIRLLALHPAGDRRMTWTYSYRAGGDTQQRMEQIIELLSEVEALPAGETTPATP